MKSLLAHFTAGTLIAGAVFSVHATDVADDPIGRFKITRYAVEGNTLLPAVEVEKLLSPYVGEQRSFGDVQQAVEALENAYRRRGYPVVQVLLPEQELNQGIVHLKVVQARIGKINVTGNRFFNEENVRRSLPSLREGEVPNIPEMSSNLQNANQNPAKRTNVQLKSAGQEEKVDALVSVDDEKPWRVAANIDNSGNVATGKTHIGLVYQNANLTGHDDVMSLQYTTSAEKPSKVSVYGVGYHLPLYGIGDSIDLYGSYSNVDSGSVAAGIFNLQVSGKGRVYGGRYNWNLDRSGDYDSRITFGIDYKAFENDVQLLGAQLGNDVTVRPLSLAYAGNWAPQTMAAAYAVSVSHNLPGGENGKSADLALARSGAEASYTVLRYNAFFTYNLLRDWQFRGSLNGQWTSDALVPGEQFGVGGAGSVRGFLARELANDKGNALSAEIYTPNICTFSGRVQCRVLAFYDAARLTRNKALPAEQSGTSIASTGLGFRLNASKHLSLQADYGYVLDAGGSRAEGDKRLHFLLTVSY